VSYQTEFAVIFNERVFPSLVWK